MTALAEAMAARCPRCKAKPGAACRRTISKPILEWFALWPPRAPYSFNEWAYRHMADGMYADYAAIGSETRRPHNDRYNAAWRRSRARSKPKPLPEPPAALVSLRAFDLIEHERLRAWLRVWGPVLWSVPRAGLPSGQENG